MGKNLTINNFTMFKCLQFIDEKLRQLNEADEMPMDDDAEIGGEKEETTPTDDGMDGEEMSSEGGEMSETPVEGGEAQTDPSQIAGVETGTFVSPIAKANWANIMLKLLRNKNPEIIVPTEFETVTTENADAVIEFVKNTDVLVDDSFGDDLNNV